MKSNNIHQTTNLNIDANCTNNINKGNSNTSDNNLSSCFFSLSPNQFTLLSTAIGVLLASNLDVEKQNVLGEFISNIGQTISTIAAQGEFLKDTNDKKDNLNQQLRILKEQVSLFEKKLNE